MHNSLARTLLAAAALAGAHLGAQIPDSAAAIRRAKECSSCAEWNTPQRPFRVFGNTYYVGPHGLSSILITSDSGHILIDGDLPESAPLIEANIEALGFHVRDVKIILNSHAHFDHAGGIAELERASGAVVAASAWSARVMQLGTPIEGDPQYGVLLPYPPVRDIRVIADENHVRVGAVTLTAHITAGHTPGGTTWTWRSCEAERCLDIVYADSQSPVSADGFYFTRSRAYPTAVADFEHGLGVIEHLPCDILMSTHPDASQFWQRLAKRDSGDANALIDSTACRRFAADARAQVAERLAKERAAQPPEFTKR